VGECARIDENAVGPQARFVNGIDDDTFVVALCDAKAVIIRSGGFVEAHVDLVERDAAIDMRFARAKEVEVRAMYNGDLGHAEIPSQRIRVIG
jgi:hypothetical protein